MERAEAWDKRRRAVTLAVTYLRKSERLLHSDLPEDPSYWELLDQALDTADEIVRALGDDFFADRPSSDMLGLGIKTVNLSDTANERIEKLVAAIAERRVGAKRNRRIELLENVEGRTPEEAASYLAKAAQLRASSSTEVPN